MCKIPDLNYTCLWYILIGDVLLVLVVVTGGKQSQLLVLRLSLKFDKTMMSGRNVPDDEFLFVDTSKDQTNTELFKLKRKK